MKPSYLCFEGWPNWPTWAVYLTLSCDGSAWAKWQAVARRVREDAAERPGLPADVATRGALAARLRVAHVRDLQSHADLNAKLLLWADEGWAYATDGCHVEPDGICPHGHPSWLLRLGLI